MADKSNANIGFEKQLWDVACVLWGHIPAAEYRKIIVGLIFLRYISGAFEKRYQELVEEGDGFEDERDAYAMENIFFVPEKARWSTVSAAAHTPEIGTEYCIAQFAEKEGVGGGEFYTPSSIVKTLVSVLKPFENCRVYDPCCGSGGIFVQSAKFIRAHRGRRGAISVYGQEANSDTWKMAKMNMAIRGIDANFGPYHADTFTNDLHPTLKSDFILANPPFDYHIEDDLIEGIVAMPTQLFYSVTIPVVKGFCAAVTLQDIEKQDYILTPGRYVGIEEQEDDGEPFEEKMTRLTSELSEMFEKSHKLEEEIRRKLGAIGYEI